MLASATVSKKQQILSRLNPIPDLIQHCLDLTNEDQMVYAQAGDLLALSSWYRDRVLMIGDAAHATSPYAGMGAVQRLPMLRLWRN